MKKRKYRARRNGNGNGRTIRLTLRPGDRLIVRVRNRND